MSQIKIDIPTLLVDGVEIKFIAPCNCSEVTGLIVPYISDDGNPMVKEFTFRDSCGNDLTGLCNLFASGTCVRAILDVTHGYAYLQNASAPIATYNETDATDESKFEEWLNSQLDAMQDNAFRYVNIASSILPGADYFGTLHKGNLNNSAVLHATNYGGHTITKTRDLFGEWKEIEYENPIMILGQEYRTTERFNSKSVYTKLVNLGTLIRAGETIVGHGVEGMTKVIDCTMMDDFGNLMGRLNYWLCNTTDIVVTMGDYQTSGNAYAILKYLKD